MSAPTDIDLATAACECFGFDTSEVHGPGMFLNAALDVIDEDLFILHSAAESART